MRYFKVVYFTNGDDYDTHEMFIDENKFRICQKALSEGADLLPFQDRVIRRAMIKEIAPADNELKEYARQGIGHIELGLPEPITYESLPEGKKSLPDKYNQLTNG